ncbi:MAG: hypothetical protein QXO00_02575 [Candidatus Bathyarchaeia archaeon]
MGTFQTASKTALFTVGVACIVAASNLLQSNLTASIILIVLGIVLILLYTHLIEKQSAERALKLAMKKLGKEAEKSESE